MPMPMPARSFRPRCCEPRSRTSEPRGSPCNRASDPVMHPFTGRDVARVLVLAAPVMILSSSCDRHPSAPLVVASVVVSPGAATLGALDQRLTLHATAFTTRGDSIPGKEFVWSSSNNGIVPVSPDGIVAANVEGTVTITATGDGISGSATITVAQVPVSLSFALPPNATY